MAAKRVVVIGSGFGGLAAAVRLQARGFEVHLCESLPDPGGRARTFHIGPYAFDGGPTVVTAPFLFEELFALAGKRMEDEVRLLPVDPFYKLFGPSGEELSYNGDPGFVLPQIERIHAPDGAGYLAFLEAARPLLQKGFIELGAEPFTRVSDMARVAPDLVRLRAYESVYTFVSHHIQHPFLRQCFTFHPLFIGGNPLKASSIYAMIHLIEQRWGVWYP
ncbi:NAD(P)-binding protein, partial [Alicyclobacillus sendaiensis]